MADVLPEIETHGYIVTDCEIGMRNAIKTVFPNVPLLRCWNHIWNAFEGFLIRNKGLKDLGFYVESARELFLQDNKSSYEVLLKKKQDGNENRVGTYVPAWDPAFAEYYNSHIEPDILGIAAFSVKELCGSMFNRINGIAATIRI